jgi:phosphomannomutase/phosphoglucomutase
MNEHIFREYDIRGIVGEQLTDETVELLARAIATFFRRNDAKRIAVGYDARESSPGFAGCFPRVSERRVRCRPHRPRSDAGTLSCGLYQGIRRRRDDHGFAQPADHNGFKICLGKSTLFGSQIQEIKQIALAGEFEDGEGSERVIEVLDDYCDDIVSKIELGSRQIKAVVDGGNGMGGVTAVPVYERLGIELVKLFTEPDSSFPNHHPDPTVTENLQDTIDAVLDSRADLGIAFDGDGDRIGIVDETGRIIWGDELMVLLSRSILAERLGSTIIARLNARRTCSMTSKSTAANR